MLISTKTMGAWESQCQYYTSVSGNSLMFKTETQSPKVRRWSLYTECYQLWYWIWYIMKSFKTLNKKHTKDKS